MGVIILVFVVMFLCLIAFCAFALGSNGKESREKLEELILKNDKGEIGWNAIEIWCNEYRISDEEYHKVRKELYNRLAEENNIDGLTMSVIYEKDIQKQRDYYIRAARLGDVESMYHLGLYYSEAANTPPNGNGYGANPKESFYWYQEAAKHGHESAMAAVAKAYNFGEGVVEDKQKAYDYAVDCAERGYAECAFFLLDYFSLRIPGMIYVSKEDAVRMMQRVMRRGERESFAKAAYQLGRLYGESYLYGLPTDDFSDRYKAAYFFTLAYVLDNDYDKTNIFKTGYRPSESELKSWQEDARNLRYSVY